MDECEEGEIVDFDDVEDGYTLLERPSRPEPPRQQTAPPAMIDSESDNDPESSSSDSDSSSGPSSMKKRKVSHAKGPKQSRCDGPPLNSNKFSRNNKYNIWTASVQEEAITSELENITGLQKFSRERGVESYDFTMCERNDDIDIVEDEEATKDEDIVEDTSPSPVMDARSKISNKRRHDERGNVKARLGRRRSPSESGRIKDHVRPRTLLDLTRTEEDSIEDLGLNLANMLCENKEELIIRVVQVIGKQKAITLFKETQLIESQGGMLIMNGARRRSPGGVFLFLVKGDDSITNDQKKTIFDEDIKNTTKELRKARKLRQRKRIEEERHKLAKDNCLPDLLTRAELVVQHAAGKLNKNSDAVVSNPPPSPATDNRGESSNDSPPHRPFAHSENRALADYENDFLDVFGEDMEEF